MTSPAIKLARECGATFYQDQAICMGHNTLKTFYAKAQAQALRDAAKTALEDGDNFLFTTELKQIADELEGKL